MSEFITVQVGQCGNQIGSAFWPLALQEYGIESVPEGVQRSHLPINYSKIQDAFHAFFRCPNDIAGSFIKKYSDIKERKIKARAVMIDMEDSVVSRYRTGQLRDLFENTCIVSNYSGSGNNWAEGYYEHGQKYQKRIIEVLRKAVEKCDSLHGFLMLFSLGGGTGSGLGTATLNLLEDNFPLIDRFVCCVYPSGTEDVITAPYNVALSTHQLTEHATCVFPIENRILTELVNMQLLKRNSETLNFVSKCKPFQDMNSIIVNMLLNLTSGSRFVGNLNVDMNDLITNMVPFPKMQYLSSSFSPLTVSAVKFNIPQSSHSIQDDIFSDICSKSHQLLKVDPLGLNSVLLGCTIIGRGIYNVSDMRRYVDKLQMRGKFTRWSKNAMKIGLCSVAPIGHSVSMLGLFNTSSISTLFENVGTQFDCLYKRKAHTHHYEAVSGFDELHFTECRESVFQTLSDYKSIEKCQMENVPRLKVL